MKLVPRSYSLFDDFFDDMFERPTYRNLPSMKTDVHEKDGNYILDIELPGYNKEDVNIELKDGYVNISATHETSDEEQDSKGNIIRQERSFGSCSRSFYVGDYIKAEDIKATFNNGILQLIVPNKEVQQIETSNKIMID
ncbi:MAG: Hsp20/alpha crystallin family protein [Erysipelotrichaceae bacterium]|nr:Hsp20/alpha crystallin family protein [Erysipelotrichaceae bacterium]MDY5251143.1 Hsp20/alpha crystallin family protein [Erysipelotrichaceae bacterium]